MCNIHPRPTEQEDVRCDYLSHVSRICYYLTSIYLYSYIYIYIVFYLCCVTICSRSILSACLYYSIINIYILYPKNVYYVYNVIYIVIEYYYIYVYN